MEPIQNQPPPYTQWDIDLFALQKEPRHQIHVQVDVSLPKPFDLVPDKKSKIEKEKKEAKEKQKKKDNKKEDK